MKILAVEGEWYNQHWNLVLRVDELPEPRTLLFERKQLDTRVYHFAERSGFCTFYAGGVGRNEGGFGGAVIDITLGTGEKVKLNGPWSSRTSVMNMLGFGPCTEAVFVLPDAQLRFGGRVREARIAAAISVKAFQRSVKDLNSDFWLERSQDAHGEIRYELQKGAHEVGTTLKHVPLSFHHAVAK